MVRILENNEKLLIYENILGVLTKLIDPKITNIHSVDLDITRFGLPNITFDYDNDVVVMINISDNNIQIIAPDDLYNKFKNIISRSYPNYKDIITK